jgi:hypothetical protein
MKRNNNIYLNGKAKTSKYWQDWKKIIQILI